MKTKAILIPALILFLLFKPSFTEEQEVLSLSLEDCIVRALKDNLQVAIEVYNPELADISLTKAKEYFVPRFDLGYENRRQENPSYWWLEQAVTVVNEEAIYSISVVQQIPTGGNLTLSFGGNKYDTTAGLQLLDPRYGSALRFDFTQPLLKNFGFKVSRREILVAQNNLDISTHQFQKVLMDTIYSVQEAYWNLFYAIEDLKVKQQSLQLARDLLAKNRKEVEVGKLAPIEILNAEAVVASREADILQAEALIRRSEDVLKNLLNLSEEALSLQRIVPSDKPSFTEREVSLEKALMEAVEKRPDLKAQKKSIETNELNLSVAKNQMLPGLDLQLSYWSPGLTGDRILYLDNNPLTGVVVGVEEGNPTDAVRDALKFLYHNWTIGLSLSFPLSNFTTRADYARARMEIEKSQLELKNLEKQILLEIRDAVREIETSFKRAQAYKLARELAEERLEAEVKKLDVGLTTNYFVLQYQEELARERSLELKALVDYNLAWAKLEKAIGTTLEKRNIKVSDIFD